MIIVGNYPKFILEMNIFDLTKDPIDKLVGFKTKVKCFSFSLDKFGKLARPRGKLLVDTYASNQTAHYHAEITYPGQYYYHLQEYELSKQEVISKANSVQVYIVILSLGKQ